MKDKNKKIPITSNMKLLTFILVGIIFGIFIRHGFPQFSLYSLQNVIDLESQVRIEQEEIEKLNQQYQEQESKLNTIMESDKYEKKRLLSDEIDAQERELALQKISGPGVSISIYDSDLELKEGQNPNELIVHELDILNIINDLKKIGVEAIAVNGQRLGMFTHILCNGPTIVINNHFVAQPFIVTAIGDTKKIEAYFQDPYSYSSRLKSIYGIRLEWSIEEEIIINDYRGYSRLSYIREDTL